MVRQNGIGHVSDVVREEAKLVVREAKLDDRATKLAEGEAAVMKREVAAAEREELVAKQGKHDKETGKRVFGIIAGTQKDEMKVEGMLRLIQETLIVLDVALTGSMVTGFYFTPHPDIAEDLLLCIDLTNGTNQSKRKFEVLAAENPGPMARLQDTWNEVRASTGKSSKIHLHVVLYPSAPKRLQKDLIVAADPDTPDLDDSYSETIIDTDSETMDGSYVEVKEEPED